MSGLTLGAIFFIIWWVVIFAVLHFGIRRQDQIAEGHDPGAPANPRLLAKAIWTSVIALLIWGAYFLATQVFGFSLLDWSLGR